MKRATVFALALLALLLPDAQAAAKKSHGPHVKLNERMVGGRGSSHKGAHYIKPGYSRPFVRHRYR